jgi:hypothetical protein
MHWFRASSKYSYAGGGRNENNVYLNALHTIFVNEHNCVAKKLLFWNVRTEIRVTIFSWRFLILNKFKVTIIP